MKIGFIGLGIMGKPMSRNLLKAGYELVVMDRKFKPGFRIRLHIKDLANVLETSHEMGVPLPLTASVMEMMQALKADGLGDLDHGALIRYYESLAKVEVKR